MVGILEHSSISFIMQFIHADVEIFMTRKFRASLASMSRALVDFMVYQFFPSIRTHIGLALFTMLHKQVIVAAFIVPLQNNKKSSTQAPPLKKSYKTVMVKSCPK